MPGMKTKSALACFVLTILLLGGCDYDEALTAKPTRRIDERFLGVWQGADAADLMTVRQLDEFHYIVAMDDDIYRASHSGLTGADLLSVQELGGDRKYVYATAAVSADGRQLTVRLINGKIVSDKIKGRAALQKVITANLANPDLFNEAVIFTRKK